MVFIPANDLLIGSRVRLTRDIKVMAGTYTKGHEFIITDYHSMGYNLQDDEGKNLIDVHPGLYGGNCPFEKI